ncbi:MAG: Flp pilus assembly complex ATPase component TadA [Phycisphaeraceae bacterium]|nr:Flp pilus assembly complex ATPase component TadA [Phycisphaeraceae bacterium]
MHTQLIFDAPAASALVLGAGAVLISWWKALLFLLPVVGWAWLISTVYDKHANRFHLGNFKWNGIHMFAALGGFAAAMIVPALAGVTGIVGFLVGFLILLVVLAADVLSYPMVANKDPRVPEAHRVRINLDAMREARQAKADAKKAGKVELSVVSPDKQLVPVPPQDTPEFALRVQAESIVLKARDLRASQLDVAPISRDGGYGVSFMIDGVRQAGDPMAPADAGKIIDFWKQAGKLDVADRRKRQRADIRVSKEEETTSVRLIATGGQGGPRLSMLFDFAEAVRRTSETLGLLEPQLEALRAIVKDCKGVVLLAAPADSGRTTMLYSVIKMHDAYTSNVQVLEVLETQDSLEGVRQNVFDPTAEGAEHDKVLRSIIRRDPDVVGVAELDAATAKEMTRADHDRVRIYASLRADNPLEAIQVWVKAVEDPAKAGAALHGVMSGKLVRKLCENCRVAYAPTPDMLKKLGLPEGKISQLFKKGGQVLVKNKPEVCPVCHGLGYAGQEGVFEVYPINADERRLIAEGNLQALRSELRKKKLPTLQQAALKKAVDGITSVEEVLRITSTESGKSRSGAAPQPAAAQA